MSKRHQIIISLIFGAIALLFLAKSLVQVGLQYTLDIDELFHINAAYQMHIGKLPYRDFLFPYTPVAQWTLSPFFSSAKPETTIAAARIISVVVFLLRMAITGIIGISLLGVPFGMLATIGILADPFTAFAGMQFRPDIFAVLFQSLSLLSFLALRKYRFGFFMFLTEFFLISSVFSSLKLFPFALGLCIAALYVEKNLIKKYKHVIFLNAVVLLVTIIVVFLSHGVLSTMLQNVFINAKAINNSLQYPLHILNFYWPVNWFLFGFAQNAPLWYWEMSIPLLSVGALAVLFLGMSEVSERKLIAIIAIPALLQAGSLFFVRSVFIQYHLPSNWLLIILAVWLMKQIGLKISSMHRGVGILFFLLLVLLTGSLAINAVKNYIDRSKVTYHSQLIDFDIPWKTIPLNVSVFPGYFFRPNGSYIGYGWNIGDLPQNLQVTVNDDMAGNTQSSIQYLYLPGEQKKYLSISSQQIITNNFTQSVVDPALWIRKK